MPVDTEADDDVCAGVRVLGDAVGYAEVTLKPLPVLCVHLPSRLIRASLLSIAW